MKNNVLIISLLALSLFIFACNKQDDTPENTTNFLYLLDDIPTNQYQDTTIFENEYSNLYGQWEVISTSGGFAGSGYPQDFDYLLI